MTACAIGATGRSSSRDSGPGQHNRALGCVGCYDVSHSRLGIPDLPGARAMKRLSVRLSIVGTILALGTATIAYNVMSQGKGKPGSGTPDSPERSVAEGQPPGEPPNPIPGDDDSEGGSASAARMLTADTGSRLLQPVSRDESPADTPASTYDRANSTGRSSGIGGAFDASAYVPSPSAYGSESGFPVAGTPRVTGPGASPAQPGPPPVLVGTGLGGLSALARGGLAESQGNDDAVPAAFASPTGSASDRDAGDGTVARNRRTEPALVSRPVSAGATGTARVDRHGRFRDTGRRTHIRADRRSRLDGRPRARFRCRQPRNPLPPRLRRKRELEEAAVSRGAVAVRLGRPLA